jgi:hypothetical protein
VGDAPVADVSDCARAAAGVRAAVSVASSVPPHPARTVTASNTASAGASELMRNFRMWVPSADCLVCRTDAGPPGSVDRNPKVSAGTGTGWGDGAVALDGVPQPCGQAAGRARDPPHNPRAAGCREPRAIGVPRSCSTPPGPTEGGDRTPASRLSRLRTERRVWRRSYDSPGSADRPLRGPAGEFRVLRRSHLVVRTGEHPTTLGGEVRAGRSKHDRGAGSGTPGTCTGAASCLQRRCCRRSPARRTEAW